MRALILFAALLSLGPTPAWAGPADTCPLKVGQTVPDAPVLALSGAATPLAKRLAGRATVLVFVRGGWCPYCNRQMAQLQQVLPTLKAIGYQVVTVTGDAPDALRKSLAELTLEYDVLADPQGKAAKAFGLVYPAGVADFGHPSLVQRWKTSHPGEPQPFLPVPAVYVIHPSGTVLYQYANVDYRVRLSAEVLLTVARAYAPRK